MDAEFLKVGTAAIDSEHEELLIALDRLKQPPAASENKDDLLALLDAIRQSIRHHFVSEEAVFEKIGMPAEDIQNHTQAHCVILEKCDTLISDLPKNPFMSRLDIYMMLHDWILVHCVRHDIKLKKFIPSDGSIT